jgi:hypothetical protein
MGDAARSDVALTAAVLLFGRLLVGGLRGGPGLAGAALDLAVVLALTALVPLLLIRSRASSGAGARTVPGALALDGPPATAAPGLPLALPVALAGTIAMITAGFTPTTAALGRLSGPPLEALQIVALSVGSLVAIVFLVRRGAAGFLRSPDWTLRRLLRTYGMGTTALALVAGLLRVPLGGSFVRVLTNATALAAVVLLADRLLDARTSAPRLAVLLPAGLVLYLHITTAGLGVGLVAGALAAGMTVIVGTLALSERGAWTTVPVLVAVHLWPTCLAPLALAPGLC